MNISRATANLKNRKKKTSKPDTAIFIAGKVPPHDAASRIKASLPLSSPFFNSQTSYSTAT
jgi:hypothetical protein